MSTAHRSHSLIGEKIGPRARIACVALALLFSAACGEKSKSSATSACLQFASDLMPDLAGGLTRKDFRLANAWAVKSDQMIDSSGVKFPAYFLSADIIAPNGEAVPGTWVTTAITKPGLIWSVSPQAQKYSTWAKAGDASTTGITMQSPGAKESISCVLTNRTTAPKPATASTTNVGASIARSRQLKAASRKLVLFS